MGLKQSLRLKRTALDIIANLVGRKCHVLLMLDSFISVQPFSHFFQIYSGRV